MTQGLQTYDYLVFVLYFMIIASYGFWIYQRKKVATVNSTDFFLAEGQPRGVLGCPGVLFWAKMPTPPQGGPVRNNSRIC